MVSLASDFRFPSAWALSCSNLRIFSCRFNKADLTAVHEGKWEQFKVSKASPGLESGGKIYFLYFGNKLCSLIGRESIMWRATKMHVTWLRGRVTWKGCTPVCITLIVTSVGQFPALCTKHPRVRGNSEEVFLVRLLIKQWIGLLRRNNVWT